MNPTRELLAARGIRRSKRLGQSFLEDTNMIRRIAALIGDVATDSIVEIGAGLGVLTAEIASLTRKRLFAIEIDQRLVSILKERFSGLDRVVVVSQDILSCDLCSFSGGGKITVVGNIPYHISSPILFHLLEYRHVIESMVLMFQKEFAARITASPGTKEYGIPTVFVSRYADIEDKLLVPRQCFYPRPKVDSMVLRIVMKGKQPGPDDAFFAKVVRASFSRRRKTLWNNLRSAGLEEQILEQILARRGWGRQRRAETLSSEEFANLAADLYALENTEKIIDSR
jgi:16S rRNA (adenine1518-N6/adenine1519-N6)-dimethyltransferase